MKSTLIKLIQEQDIKEVKRLSSSDSNINFNFTDDYGNNLLHFAVAKITENTLSLIQFLLERGVDPLSVNERFETPMDLAKVSNNIPALTLMKHYINQKIKQERDYN